MVWQPPTGMLRVFLDSAPIIYFVESPPTYSALVDPLFAQIDDGLLQGVTSPVALAECLVIPIRAGRPDVQRDFMELIAYGTGIHFVTTNAAIAQQAAWFRAVYNLSLTDALQVATAVEAGCDTFLTNDRGLQRVQELRVMVLSQMEEQARPTTEE